jgi:hypothetical protein
MRTQIDLGLGRHGSSLPALSALVRNEAGGPVTHCADINLNGRRNRQEFTRDHRT